MDTSWPAPSTSLANATTTATTTTMSIADRNELALETKRDKRRRDMTERVERYRRDTVDRKDEIYEDLQKMFGSSHAAMSQRLSYIKHPEYLMRLHALSVQRDADILAARLESAYAVETARQLYHTEVDRVEDEYEAAKKAIREKLLEACDERARRLREEKDATEISALESVFDLGQAKHSTRRSRATLAANGAVPSHSVSLGVGITGLPLPTTADGHASSALMATSSTNGFGNGDNDSHALSPLHTSDIFNFSLLPSSPALGNGQVLHPSMLLLQPGSSALLASLKSGSAHYHTHRTTGGRAKAGYPPNGIVVTPGSYQVLGKSITAINTLRAEEIADDMEGILRATRQRHRSGRRERRD